MKRKLLALAAAALLLVSLAGCGRGGISTEFVEPDMSTEESLTITWLISTQQTVKLTDTPAFKSILKKLNVKIDLIEKGSADYQNYKNTQLSRSDFPDIVSSLSASEAKEYGAKGALAELSQYLDYMPNYKKLAAAAIAEDPDNYALLYDREGGMFAVNHYNYDPVPLWDFSYNKEAFDAVMKEKNIADLTTWERVEQVLLGLKEKYPNSWPLTFAKIDVVGIKKPIQLFVESFTGGKAATLNHLAFDPASDSFVFAPEVPGYREAIAFLHKLYAQNLIDPDYLAQDLVTTLASLRVGQNKSFMTAGYVGGYVGNNALWRGDMEGYVPLEIPVAAGQNKTFGRKMTHFDEVCTGINWRTLSGNPQKLGRVLQLLDYLYSDEFLQMQWHHPDVTVAKEVDGSTTYTYKNEIYEKDATVDYAGIYFPWSLFANFQDLNDERPAPGNPYIGYRAKLVDPANASLYAAYPNVSFGSSDQRLANQYNTRIEDYYGSAIAKFINGETALTDESWNAFVNQLKNAGGKGLAELYNNAYQNEKANRQ